MDTLTDAVMHLIAVLLQVVLDAALEEVQLGLQLLGEAKHVVLTPGEVGVVPQEAQPGQRTETGGTSPSEHSSPQTEPVHPHTKWALSPPCGQERNRINIPPKAQPAPWL